MFDEKLLNHKSLVKHHKLFDGVQYIYKLNGCTNYSVVRHWGSYGSEEGLYEVAPIVFDDDGSIVVDGEPEGYLTVEEVLEILEVKKYEF